MSTTAVLMKALGAPLGKFLLKKYLSDPAEAVGMGVFDVAQSRITDYADQREAQRQFERLGERIVARLVPLFERETRNTDLSIEAVAHELAETLDGHVSAEFFLERELDPAKLAAALRAARPIRASQFSAAEISLYDRALDETVRYLVQIASRLPKFEEAYARVSLQRLDRMGQDLEEVLDTTRRTEQAVTLVAAHATKAEAESARYEADYRLAVARNLDYLELFGADISPESRRHALSVAYISLNLSQPGGDQSGPLPVEMVLAGLRSEQGRLLIRGSAGSGKSTLARWTAIQAASPPSDSAQDIGKRVSALGKSLEEEGVRDRFEWRDRPADAHWRTKIPFLVRLRDCKDGKLPGPDDFPAHVASELGNPPPNWVASVLRQGRALVLLDGIDEVPNVHREDLRRAITNIVNAYPDNYFIASTRPTAVEEGWLAAAGFREAAVDPMSEVDRALFIEKWHQAVARELERVGRPDASLPRVASELIEQLPEHPPVARLATTPLLCAMICALHRDRSQHLPESQSELCEAICHMLLHRREQESGLSMNAFPEAYRALSYREKRAIVQDIAHYMVRNGESAIAWERARKSVEHSLKQFPDRKEIDANELLTLLIERSGVLRETRPREVDFIHNTLKEFLAAELFADDGDAGLLADRYADASWQPVILFSVATDRRGFATQVLRRILDPRGGDRLGQDEMRARRLFALRGRAAALHLAPELHTELDSIKKSLFPPRSMADAEALASGGDAVVDYLWARTGSGDDGAAACVRTLRLIGTRRAHQALRSYLDDERRPVVSELAQALNPLEITLVRGILLRGDNIPQEFRAQITDLTPLRDLGLTELDLSGAWVKDLAPIAGLTSLQSLHLADTRVSDLAPIAGLTSLHKLYLAGTQVSDLAPIAGLTSLQSLYLANTQVSNLAPIAGLTSLQSLHLANTQVSDLAPIAGLTSLQSLHLARTQVSNLAPIAGLTSLQSLYLAGTQVNNLAPIAGLTSLQWLDLDGTQVSDLAPIAHLDLQVLFIPQKLDASMLDGKAGLTIYRR